MFANKKSLLIILSLTLVLASLIVTGTVVAAPAQLPELGEAANSVAAQPAARLNASAPSRIVMPSIQVDTVVINSPRVGNTWDTSHMTWQAAHMEGTPYPGQGGNVVVMAHRYLGFNNADLTNPGPFAYIDRLKAGDQVQLYADSNVYIYQVTEQYQVGITDIWVIQPTPSEVLTLMSCSGWNPVTRTMETRLVVRAALVGVQPASGPAPAAAPGGVTATSLVNLRLRSGAGVSYTPIGVVPPGASLNVVGRNSANNWMLVEVNGMRGWVAAWYTNINGSLGSVPVVGG